MSKPYHTELTKPYINRRNTCQAQRNAQQTRQDQEPRREETIIHHRDKSPRQRNGENRDRPRGVQRQRKEPHAGPYVREKSRNAQTNYAWEAKNPPMTSILGNNTPYGIKTPHQ